MKKKLDTITRSEIEKLNNGSRWKTDAVIQYWTSRQHLFEVASKSANDQCYIVRSIGLKDLQYRYFDYNPPIGRREQIAWLIAGLSLAMNGLQVLLSL